jgi:hypothetical protein
MHVLLQVDLLVETKISGFVSQGSVSGHATEIGVRYGRQKSRLRQLKHRGTSTVCMPDKCKKKNISRLSLSLCAQIFNRKNLAARDPMSHLFPNLIVTKWLKFEIISFVDKPCLRVDILGCDAEQSLIISSWKFFVLSMQLFIFRKYCQRCHYTS